MAIHVALQHRTVYTYDRPISLSPQIIRLHPAAHTRTPIPAYSLTVEPEGNQVFWQQDPHGNRLARAVFPEPVDRLVVQVDIVALMVTINPFDFFLDDFAMVWGFTYPKEMLKDLGLYCRKVVAGPKLSAYMKTIPTGITNTVDRLVAINAALANDIRYLIRMEPGVQSCETTLGKGSGSCRDSAWLLVQILRHLGLAARFVSGYLIQLVPDQKTLEGPQGATTDFTDLHAWTEVFLPGAGWVGMDPTSGLLAGEGHIPLASTASPGAAAPIEGGYTFVQRSEDDTVTSTFDVSMTITRLDDRPRATKPFREDQWQAIRAVGKRIDTDLIKHDVRLTQGGEPTFVSAEDLDGPEWTTEALGDTKMKLADQMLRRMQQRFAPGGVLHHGQGKWYPGEPLPRWAYTCWWRVDGEPVWRDPALIASNTPEHPAGADEAEQFARALTDRLGVGPTHLVPAYEDAFYHAWREQRLPTNVDPLANRLDNPQERARLARIFEIGLNAVAGWTLPLRCVDRHWQSAPWYLRGEHLFLLPGDSSMGLRLPLDSLPWVAAADREDTLPDPMEPRAPLPSRQVVAQRVGEAVALPPPEPQKSAADHVRTALCVEPRAGVLHVFMPPLVELEDWLALVAAIEDTAKDLAIPVQLEGYGAPRDARLRSLAVTPDPGVIEVNVHPARDWDELEDINLNTYAEAHGLRLRSEKFDLDGRHTGTGGGNHVTFGGATPADSPFLRRPDLLRSLLAYLHNHPSLTYFFSGSFVGATSQSPRPDEARLDSTYELEHALKLLDGLDGKGVPPWTVDRLLRNALTDLTGNTHRTELSIDKLFAPDSASGRLGLVELRSQEMPPDPRMAMCQFALLRGLIARFWQEPYRQPLAHWGTLIHDRWMLPWHLRRDLDSVIEDLRASGYPFDPGWFDAQEDFRFPVLGSHIANGLEVEVRSAIEPWEVLGEQATASGTARYVDSSMERIQLTVRGGEPGRYQIMVNGYLAPLRRVAADVGVCGIRYRAWQPPNCLHPTVGIDAPLIIDWFDSWNGRSVAGCRHHVIHPGGRGYERFPINAYEAEARRMARFEMRGHSGGLVTPRTPRFNPDMPNTLDLRREQI